MYLVCIGIYGKPMVISVALFKKKLNKSLRKHERITFYRGDIYNN